MTSYRICFFNEIPDSTGHDHHVCQRSIEIDGANDREQAIARAIVEFERLEGVSHWQIHARTLECSAVSLPCGTVADRDGEQSVEPMVRLQGVTEP